jgi:hypothetical protein
MIDPTKKLSQLSLADLLVLYRFNNVLPNGAFEKVSAEIRKRIKNIDFNK